MSKAGTENGPKREQSDLDREAAICETIALLEDALRRCDGEALHIAAIHIDRALHECRKRLQPADDKEG